MTLRHSFLVALLVLSSAPLSIPCASAEPTTVAAAQGRQTRQKRIPPKPANKQPKQAPLGGGGGGGGTGGGGTTGGGTTTGGSTTGTTKKTVRRRRGGRRRGGRRQGNRQGGRKAPGRKGGGKQAGKGRKGPKGTKAAPAPIETPIYVESRFEQEEGVPGTTPPQPLDVLVEDRPVHADQHGRAPRQLLALDGHPDGGFAAAWLDLRDDSPHVYIGRFDQDGRSLEPERPAANDRTPVAGLAADLKVGPDGSGTLFWSPPAAAGNRLRLRSFEYDGGFSAPERPTGPPWAGPTAANPTLGSTRLARRPDGSAVLVSRRAGEVALTELDPHGRQIGTLETVSTGRREAIGDPVVTTGPLGEIVAAWPAAQGIVVWKRAQVGAAPQVRLLGLSGTPIDLAYEVPTVGRPASVSGAWLLLDGGGALRLARLDAKFALVGKPTVVTAEAFDRAELEVWAPGPAVLVESGAAGGVGALALHVMRFDGVRVSEPVQVLPAGVTAASGARLAATADRMMVAWTDAREGSTDLYARVFERDRDLSSTEVRLTTDHRSAAQDQPAVASNETLDRAVMVWTDRRDGVARVYARRVARGGELAPAELAVPATGPTPMDEVSACSRPSVAVDGAGRFLVVWKERDGDRYQVRAQAFGSDDRPLAPAFELDSGFASAGDLAAAVAALRQESGWAVLWDRVDSGARLAHVAADGQLGIRHIAASESTDVRSLAIEMLDDGRLVTVWSAASTSATGEPETRVQGRLLTLDLRTSGLEVDFDVVSDFADGLALARSRDGGFAMAWTRGGDQGRDVLVGFFDRYGLPAAAPVVITPEQGSQRDPSITRLADRSWVVAWQDDLSGTDLVHARRVRFDPIRLGPTFTVNQLASARNEARRSPRVAALGDGFVAAWIDARRSLGADVFARVLGPGFDGVIWSKTGQN